MKTCPVCNSLNFDDATKCPACLHDFMQEDVVITAQKATWFKSRIAEMSRIYADDIAREVAEELGRLIRESNWKEVAS